MKKNEFEKIIGKFINHYELKNNIESINILNLLISYIYPDKMNEIYTTKEDKSKIDFLFIKDDFNTILTFKHNIPSNLIDYLKKQSIILTILLENKVYIYSSNIENIFNILKDYIFSEKIWGDDIWYCIKKLEQKQVYKHVTTRSEPGYNDYYTDYEECIDMLWVKYRNNIDDINKLYTDVDVKYNVWYKL